MMTILAIINAINTGFLYFSFNTRAALDNAAKVGVTKKVVKVDEEKQPLVSPGVSTNSSRFFPSPNNNKNTEVTELSYPKSSSCLLL